MEADSVDAAAEWDVVPAGRGHDGLRDLAADGFSGGVTDGRVWAMLTNGRVVGVSGGEMADLADAELTAHEAPDPALPLLLVMRERSGAPRAQYYTEETPLAEVDDTLRRGGFTGYVELSENVLSGDYYLVYYGGDRMPVAFVGGSRRLETGEEAFDRATGEVGIYDVHDVDVSVVTVPGGEGETTAGAVVDGTDAEAEDDGEETADGTGDDTRDGVSASASFVETDGPASVDATGAPADGAHGRPADDETAETAAGDGAPASGSEETAPDEDPGDAGADDTTEDDGGRSPGRDRDPAGDGRPDSGGERASEAGDEDGGATADVDGRLAELRTERAELRERIETLTAERDDLREEVARLRTEVERSEASDPDGSDAGGRALPADAALSGTSLFVRYRSKADPTLGRALDDGAEREAVNENLLLERHTTFETEGATVDGEPYEEFLPATLQYRFVEWLVRDLPFELRDAAGKGPLGRLYKAIPAFDRAEVDGSVTVQTDGGEEERTFGVVVRDRKGAPLVVASLFDGREPATEAMLSELVADARAAAAANESLGAAVFVTTSYYAPGALELAEAETSGGGLFGRGSRESYVRLDRSHGFHLCLVEARDDDFHLGVPDL
jgi:hypothetical protein